jgi:hypothetical protein
MAEKQINFDGIFIILRIQILIFIELLGFLSTLTVLIHTLPYNMQHRYIFHYRKACDQGLILELQLNISICDPTLLLSIIIENY